MNSEHLKSESIAYALAAGMVSFGSARDQDRDIERAARRARRERSK